MPHRDDQDRYIKRVRRAATDIAPSFPDPPEGEHGERREEADGSLERFLSLFFPETFYLPWSSSHLELIEAVESTIVSGGQSIYAYPRGSGKTSCLRLGALWSIVTARRKYACIIAATAGAADDLLDAIKVEIRSNYLLQAAYGQELHCLLSLKNQARNAGGQHYDGIATMPDWTHGSIGFGSLPDVNTCGAVITTAGMEGGIRGQQRTIEGGGTIRPDLVLLDDVQTRQSASSVSETKKRLRTVQGDVLKLSGPNVPLAVLMACTVISRGDLADQLLDRTLNPAWQGTKISMIKSWPKNRDRWDEYHSIRVNEQRAGETPDASTQFVEANYDELHEGSEMYWPERKGECVSALHHAMDEFYADPESFMAEFQNEPDQEASEDIPFELDVDAIARRTSTFSRNELPENCTHLTAGVDVQQEILFYIVLGWAGARCHIVDYGSFPEQPSRDFNKRSIRYTLADLADTSELSAYTRHGLESLCGRLLSTDYISPTSTMQIDRIAIDVGFNPSSEVVRQYCSESEYRARLHPSRGVSHNRNSLPWQKLRNDGRGLRCRLKDPKEGRGRKELEIDTNFWKTCAAERLSINENSDSAITLFKSQPYMHRMIAEHFCCETCERRVGRQTVIEWDQPGGQAPNDYWDCLIMAMAAASVIGVPTHAGQKAPPKENTRRVSAAHERFAARVKSSRSQPSGWRPY